MIYVNARFLTQPITGVQRYAIELSLCLRRMDKDIKFICPKNIILKDVALQLEAEPIGERTGHFWEQIDLPRYLKKKGAPILLNLCNTAPLFYKRKISVIHDIIYKLFPESCSFAFRLWYLILIPRVVNSSLKIITVSDFSRSEIAKEFNYPLDKIYIIHNAVNEKFKPNTDVKCKKNYLLAVSSVNYHKNYDRMIQAYTNLYKKNKHNIELVIIGGQNQCFAKQTYDITNMPISFAGRVSDKELIQLYQNATAFIFPSLYEGFGIPPLEAQACGCPVLSSNTSAMPEVLEKSCIYFEPTDISDIERAISTIIEDSTLQQKLREAGLQNIKRFNWNTSAKILYTIIKETENKHL